ncbi:uncharacterized protein LOC117180446 [Belonocnema kinseyi]|uniref:uncharacterized protein LOC117180446 n=1 Tax=Belonocnema kinseyi TaxID=2817044 RepID=UPI00143DC4F8|nr:uncharacterized protein LOC117180446 [Belonocnema kinseyi]
MVNDYECAEPTKVLFQRCAGTQVMSTLDLTSSFWQVPLHPDSMKYTAFLYEGKCYEFCMTPFGLETSTAALVSDSDSYSEAELRVQLIKAQTKARQKKKTKNAKKRDETVEEKLTFRNVLMKEPKQNSATEPEQATSKTPECLEVHDTKNEEVIESDDSKKYTMVKRREKTEKIHEEITAEQITVMPYSDLLLNQDKCFKETRSLKRLFESCKECREVLQKRQNCYRQINLSKTEIQKRRLIALKKIK